MFRYLLILLFFSMVANAQKGLDTVLVFPEIKDSLSFTKKEFKEIIAAYPMLASDYVRSPDLSYAADPCGARGDEMALRFSSEVGKDQYYMLYAYFLKQKAKNSDSGVRRRLLRIYQDINWIQGELSGGGTYFGHQYARILGYAEYALYCYNVDSSYYQSSYSISTQKKLFIQSLRQQIADELQNNYDFTEVDKMKLKKELLATVNELDKLITKKFYLKEAMKFEYSYY